jgi:integrase
MNHDDLFRWARKCSSIGLFFYEVVSNGAVSPDRLIYLSFGECDQLLDACIAAAHMRPMVMLALHTGMRRGEILNLE